MPERRLGAWFGATLVADDEDEDDDNEEEEDFFEAVEAAL